MKYLLPSFLLLALIFITSFKTDEGYRADRLYTIKQLEEDFSFLRKTLEKDHPRVYEYTSKRKFDHFLDSLYASIDKPMTEREFQYFLSLVIGKVRCSHTKIMPSQYLSDHFGDYFKAPPFRLYFTDTSAHLLYNYSTNTAIKPGARIQAINGVSIEEIRKNFLQRMHQEGYNQTFIYNRMNSGIYGLFPGICDYPSPDSYKLTFINPRSKRKREENLKAISYSQYQSYLAAKKKPTYQFSIVDSLHTGILTISSFNISDEKAYFTFLEQSFKELKEKKVENLIVDVRGNIGGIPEASADLLQYLMKKEFVYYKVAFVEYYQALLKPMPLKKDKFEGNLFFLADGGGRSTTGHFLSLVKYHQLGPILGEESCASYSCNNNGDPHTLPNTKLIFNCPYPGNHDTAVEGLPRGRGVMPDYEIKPTIEDLLAEKDVVFAQALQLIKDKN
jgi:hypothetical protein